MDLTRQFVTSYPVLGRGGGGPLQTGFPAAAAVAGMAPAPPGGHAESVHSGAAVATPSGGGESSPGGAPSPAERHHRPGHVTAPRAPVVGCLPLPQTTQHVHALEAQTPLHTNLFSPPNAAGPAAHLSKHLNFGSVG